VDALQRVHRTETAAAGDAVLRPVRLHQQLRRRVAQLSREGASKAPETTLMPLESRNRLPASRVKARGAMK
jgi:hypothetical protein